MVEPSSPSSTKLTASYKNNTINTQQQDFQRKQGFVFLSTISQLVYLSLTPPVKTRRSSLFVTVPSLLAPSVLKLSAARQLGSANSTDRIIFDCESKNT
ncbi:hypothetical protein SDJN03_03702, partial [Cucurbita argyrosperma subsp. sororia]